MSTNDIHELPQTTSSSFSRFHAIVAAKPLHGIGPPVIEQRLMSYEPWSMQFHSGKRKRDTPEASMAIKAVKRDHEGNLAREVSTESSEYVINFMLRALFFLFFSFLSDEPTKLYHNREELLRSLKNRFSQGPDVDFHGIYELSDSGITHKQRIQTVTHEIWKTTGYRFTVKDHPQVTNGHKTRFWCSQDEAHRSKSSRAARKAQGGYYTPRVTSAGEIMAKARYPCRSRLLISSRDSDKAGMRIITVRMHHHFAHEPYVDSNLPPEVAQGIWESFGWIGQSGLHPSSAFNDNVINGGQEVGSSHNGIHQEADDVSTSSDEDKDSPVATLDNMDEDYEVNSLPAPTGSGPSTDIYHDRMSTHIKNLREFCDGLEYQLQFNDYRMLKVLEREGGSFLSLVEDCLRKEGRLVIAERPVLSHSGTQHDMNSRQVVVDHVPIRSGSHEPPDNPGINPEALSH